MPPRDSLKNMKKEVYLCDVCGGVFFDSSEDNKKKEGEPYKWATDAISFAVVYGNRIEKIHSIDLCEEHVSGIMPSWSFSILLSGSVAGEHIEEGTVPVDDMSSIGIIHNNDPVLSTELISMSELSQEQREYVDTAEAALRDTM